MTPSQDYIQILSQIPRLQTKDDTFNSKITLGQNDSPQDDTKNFEKFQDDKPRLHQEIMTLSQEYT